MFILSNQFLVNINKQHEWNNKNYQALMLTFANS